MTHIILNGDYTLLYFHMLHNFTILPIGYSYKILTIKFNISFHNIIIFIFHGIYISIYNFSCQIRKYFLLHVTQVVLPQLIGESLIILRWL